MRTVNTFRYKNKTFRAGELTVGDYGLSLHDFEAFLEKVLSEFNPEPPKLEKEYLQAFLDILFDKKEDFKVFRKGGKTNPDDFHIVLGVFMQTMKQGYTDACAMPLRVFNLMMADMECILDPSKYDPNRHDTTPDRTAIRKQFGNATEIKS